MAPDSANTRKGRRTDFRRHARGLLVAPVVVPIAYWMAMAAEAALYRPGFGLDDAFAELAPVLVFGLPVAYGVALVWGVPVGFVLYRLGALRLSTLIVVGALGGVAVALWFEGAQGGGPIRVRMSLPLGTLLGALAGGIAWWAGEATARLPGSAAPRLRGRP